ncbi:MAG: hypothetical protein AB1700_15000 [Bacillota bacterium]
MNKIVLAIKDNNCATNDPCALCGARTDPSCGPELFLADSWSLVCHECGEKHAPGLVRLLDLARNAEEYYLAQWGGRPLD